MTGRNILARRYALALAQLAHEKGQLDQVEQGLAQALEGIEADPELKRVWHGVQMPAVEKVRRLRQQLGSRVPDMVFRFLGVVAAKGRESLLAAMVEQFSIEADRIRQVVRVDVETAAPLSAQEEGELRARLARLLGARAVRLSVRVNPRLMAGMVVRAGDRRIDGSLTRKLEELHRRLRTAPLEGVAFRDGKAG